MRFTRLPFALLVTALAGCEAENPFAVPTAAPDAATRVGGANGVVDISGTWTFSERSFLVLKPAGEVIHITCSSPDGVLTIAQTGSTFTGTLTHPTSNCQTKDGQAVPPPWPMPYEAVFTGHITGAAIHLVQQDAPPAPPVNCPKHGRTKVEDDRAVELSITGRCDLSFLPFPAVATNSATATRD